MNLLIRPDELKPKRFPTADAFLEWLRDQDRRYELVNGEVVDRPGTSKQHWRLANRSVVVLAQQLDPLRWSVGGTDFAVRIGKTIRFPDVIAHPLPNRSSAGPVRSEALDKCSTG